MTHVAALGLEVSDRIVRAVTVDSAGSRLGSLALDLADDGSSSLSLALARVADMAGGREPVPTRIAWFPDGTTWQLLDVGDDTDIDLATRRADLFERDGVNATALTELANGVTGLVAARWDDRGARRLARLARSCGLGEVVVEPAPTALSRVLPADVSFVRRTVDEVGAWMMLSDRGVPVIATTLPRTRREFPTTSVGTVPAEVPRMALDQSSILAFATAAIRGAATSAWREPDVVDGVALGAAIGSLGPGERSTEALHFVIERTDAEIERSPWTLERWVDDDTAPPDSRWRRWLDRLRRRRRDAPVSRVPES